MAHHNLVGEGPLLNRDSEKDPLNSTSLWIAIEFSAVLLLCIELFLEMAFEFGGIP